MPVWLLWNSAREYVKPYFLGQLSDCVFRALVEEEKVGIIGIAKHFSSNKIFFWICVGIFREQFSFVYIPGLLNFSVHFNFRYLKHSQFTKIILPLCRSSRTEEYTINYDQNIIFTYDIKWACLICSIAALIPELTHLKLLMSELTSLRDKFPIIFSN